MNDRQPSREIRMVKLFVGCLFLFGLLFLLAFGPIPGGVIKHNLQRQINAAPLFYTEVEGIFQMGRDLQNRQLTANKP